MAYPFNKAFPMQNQSKRHHYVPEFLIKNFGDNLDKVYVYDKTTSRIWKQNQSPKSIFFEMYRNTFSSHGKQLDDIEQLYGRLDDMIAVDLISVLDTRVSTPDKGTTPEQLVSLILLASSLKWRVPANDEKFNILKEDDSLDDLKIEVKVANIDNLLLNGAFAELQTTELFKQYKRFILPLLPLLGSDESKLKIFNNSFIKSQPAQLPPALLGDCPVIEKPNAVYNKLEDLILPLSSTETLIYKSNSKKTITDPNFYLYKDLAVFHTAMRYVICRDKNRLEDIAALYRNLDLNKVGGNSQLEVFNFIN